MITLFPTQGTNHHLKLTVHFCMSLQTPRAQKVKHNNSLLLCVCLCMCRFADSLLKAVPQVLGLQEQLKKAVQDGDMETSHGICRIAVALGETHCRLDIMTYVHH